MRKIATARAVVTIGAGVWALWRAVDDRPAPTAYDVKSFLLNDGRPWAIPSYFWRIPIIPIRIYMRWGDALLFKLWWWSRRPVYALADALHEDPVVAGWNAELLREREARQEAQGADVDEWDGYKWLDRPGHVSATAEKVDV